MHVIYNGQEVKISHELENLFDFLRDISNEIESFIGMESMLKKVHQSHVDLIEYSRDLLALIEGKQYGTSPPLSLRKIEESILELQNFTYPIRSVIIALFSYLEVIYCINTAYLHEQYELEQIIKISGKEKNINRFLNSYLLTNRNNCYHTNEDLFINISAKELRFLRNTLVHFYSPTGRFTIIPKSLEEKGRNLQEIIKKKDDEDLVSLSPNMLYLLINDAVKLTFIDWTKDYYGNHEKFMKRILCVKKLVETLGAIKMPDSYFDVIEQTE